MNKKEIQEKLNNPPKPKYLYQRYNGEIRKYEVQDNILIDVKNAADIINLDKQIILGKPSEDILDLLEVGDYVNGHKINLIDKKHRIVRGALSNIIIQDYHINTIVTKEQFKSMEVLI